MKPACASLRALVAMIVVAGLGPFAADCVAQTPAGFARLTILVGTPSGGGYDALGRLVSRHLPAQIAGSPTVVVQNMPGGGSLIAANYLTNIAAKDGSVIAVLPNGALFEAILGNRNAHFDARKIPLLGSLNKFTSVGAVWHTAPFVSAQDFLHGGALIGASAANSNNSIVPNLLNSLAGSNFTIINGYPGSTGVDLALERGEVQGLVGSDWSFMKVTRSAWLRDNKLRVLLQATLQRADDLRDVPGILEIAPAQNRDVLALLIGRQTYGGLFMATPGAPEAAVTTLRRAFAAMLVSAEFRNDAEKSRIVLEPSSADEVDATMRRLLSSPPDVIARATAELRKIDP